MSENKSKPENEAAEEDSKEAEQEVEEAKEPLKTEAESASNKSNVQVEDYHLESLDVYA